MKEASITRVEGTQFSWHSLVPSSGKDHLVILVLCSYAGEHYTINEMGGIDQHFNKSSDGINWEPVNPENEVTYRGGISEIGWAFDLDGNIWGVGRNEDGDDSGWGSRIFSATAEDLSHWSWTEATGINGPLSHHL